MHYFTAIRLNVSTDGTYSFFSNSTIDSYGYLYNGSFNASKPLVNLMLENDNSYGRLQFLIVAVLQRNITYTLVYTTRSPLITGRFQIKIYGPSIVDLDQLNISSVVSKYMLGNPQAREEIVRRCLFNGLLD
jgi:hypothetical protein